MQLRAVRQHVWANQVEDDGRKLGTGYKFGFGSDQVHDYYRIMGDAFYLLDRGDELPEALMEELRAAYAKIQPILRPPRAPEPELSESDIRHFLVVYDLAAEKASVREFGTDYDAALGAYAEAEEDLANRDSYDIVLIGAESLETIKRTHSSYFHTEQTFESLLPAGVLSR